MLKSTQKFLGERIKTFRKSRKLSQAQLAERVGIDPKYMSRIEVGMVYPSLKTLLRIGEALGTPVREFFESSDGKSMETCESCLVKQNFEGALSKADPKKVATMAALLQEILK